MILPSGHLTLELIPHCASVPQAGWAASHDIRPLADRGMRQASALAAAIGTGVDGIYSSPALRCRQTVAPLAAAAGLPVRDLTELSEADGFAEPAEGTQGMPDLMVHACGGAWAAGRMLRAVTIMMDTHPEGRVAAASHGDVIPVLLTTLSSAFGLPWTSQIGPGGLYTLQFGPDGLAISPHHPMASD